MREFEMLKSPETWPGVPSLPNQRPQQEAGLPNSRPEALEWTTANLESSAFVVHSELISVSPCFRRHAWCGTDNSTALAGPNADCRAEAASAGLLHSEPCRLG